MQPNSPRVPRRASPLGIIRSVLLTFAADADSEMRRVARSLTGPCHAECKTHHEENDHYRSDACRQPTVPVLPVPDCALPSTQTAMLGALPVRARIPARGTNVSAVTKFDGAIRIRAGAAWINDWQLSEGTQLRCGTPAISIPGPGSCATTRSATPTARPPSAKIFEGSVRAYSDVSQADKLARGSAVAGESSYGMSTAYPMLRRHRAASSTGRAS
jgi:hypothetical protein